MKAIDFVARTSAGAVQFGEIGGAGDPLRISVDPGSEISLNLRQADIAGYQRQGADLAITLADGRVILIEDYFSGDLQVGRLFVSADGYLNEVTLTEGTGDSFWAHYGLTAEWGKWSPDEALIFLNEDGTLMAPSRVAGAAAGDDEVSMLAALPLLGGLGAGGAAAAAAAALVGGAVLAGGGGGGGSGPAAPTRIEPSVNEKDPIIRDGDDPKTITISGQAQPGSTVTVVIGDQTVTTTPDADGDWSAEFTGPSFPVDGDHDVAVNVVENPGPTTDLPGPAVVIDTTPPVLDFTDGTQSATHVVNAAGHADGVDIDGTGEPGAAIVVTVQDVTKTTTVAADGTWTVGFTPAEIPEGEYTTPVNVVTTDSFGNAATYTDMLVVDTVPHPITINTAIIGGDGTVNGAEAAGGITVSGTSAPGAVLTVTIDGASQSVTVAADGTWEANWPAGVVAGGEYVAQVTATTVDGVGNPSSASGTFRIDTVGMVTISADAIAGNDVVSAAEAAAGITLTGTTQPGSTVTVDVAGVTRAATVAADGNWTVTYAAGSLPNGSYDATATASATDVAGNLVTTTRDFRVDTETAVSITGTGAGTDGVLNAAERAAGIIIAGQAEPGSTAVAVTLNGVTHMATIAADGRWQVAVAAADLPSGERDLTMTVNATDNAGNSASAEATLTLDTVVNRLTTGTDAGGADRVINAAEHRDGVVIRGLVEPGSTVMVALGATQVAASVAADGTWTATFAAAQVPMGDLTVPVTATATDAAGNIRNSTVRLDIDTVFNSLALGPAPVEGDNVINFREAQDGVTLTGTSDPGAIVNVSFGSGMRQVVTNAQGAWQASFLPAELPADADAVPVTATTTDAAGNVITVTGALMVDTVVDNLGIAIDPVNGLGIINSAALVTGIVLTGTTEPGSTLVQVVLDGRTVTASVTPEGNWTARFAPSQLPSGERDAVLTVTATDRAGNTGSVTETVRVDTLVNRLENDSAPVEGDNVVNAAEARDGVRLSGRVEAGSAVNVTFDGRVIAATVGGDGTWTANIPAAAIRAGSYDTTVMIAATDAAGNTATITRALAIDTDVPDAASIANYTRNHSGIIRIGVDTTGDDLTVAEVRADGSIVDNRTVGVEVPVLSETLFSFSPGVPDGSHLIVNATDAAGNTSGTYLVFDELTTSVVNLPAGLGAYQIDAIDLQFAEDSQLTITEAQLLGLSSNSNSLLIHGGTDDTVTARGAERVTGSAGSVEVEGQGYVVYTLGADGRLIIDEDIQVLI
jgi:hypothetical protein